MSLTITRTASGYALSFRYDAALVAAVKALPSRKFDPTNKSWSVPTSCAAELRALLGRLNGTPVEYGPGAREALDGATVARTEALVARRAQDRQGGGPRPPGPPP